MIHSVDNRLTTDPCCCSSFPGFTRLLLIVPDTVVYFVSCLHFQPCFNQAVDHVLTTLRLLISRVLCVQPGHVSKLSTFGSLSATTSTLFKILSTQLLINAHKPPLM